jgi:ABC-type protease/lipase transport system fused ATPase/permease subunit
MNNDILFEMVCCEGILKETTFQVPANCVAVLAGNQDCCRVIVDVIRGKRALQGGCVRIGGRDPFQCKGLVYCVDICEEVLKGTIYQQIANARPATTAMEVLEAAAAGMVMDFMWEMPEGIHSSGEGLTACQRMCVEIARAILQEAPVVVVENVGEDEVVWKALREMARRKTVVVMGGTEMSGKADVYISH